MFIQIVVVAAVCLGLIFLPIIGPFFKKNTSDQYKSVLHFIRSSATFGFFIASSWFIAGILLQLAGIAFFIQPVQDLIVMAVTYVLIFLANLFIRE